MAFAVSTFPRIGHLRRWTAPSVKTVHWDVYQFMCERKEQKINMKDFKSDDISFDGATWTLFVSYENLCYQFGINVHNHSDAVIACSCSISCEDIYGKLIKKMESDFKCASDDSHSEVIGTISYHFDGDKASKFINRGAFLVCKISVQKYIIQRASSEAEISHSTGSSDVEAPTQDEIPESEEEELSTASADCEVCQDLKKLLVSEEYSDVTLQVGDQKFKGHWLILAARSPVFTSMLRHDTKEKATGVMNVEDCELSSFPVFLEYMYCGTTEKISSENVFNLYVSADKYDVQDLRRKCLEFMMTNLSVDTFCETLRLCLQHPEKKLLKLATEFFVRNFQQIILTPKWQAFILDNPIQGNELFIKAAKAIK